MMSALPAHRFVAAVVVAIAILVLAPFAFGQQVGIKGGVNLASLTPEEDEDPDTSRRLGPVGGIWVRITPAARVSLQVEGLFSEKGMKLAAPELGIDSADLRIRYFEIPVLARAAVGSSGQAARVFVVGGAAPAFKLSGRAHATSGGEEDTRVVGDEIYGLDLGLVGGLGLEFGRAVIEARYTHGIRHINTDDNGDEDRIKNRVFSVTVGVRLR
jgi:hypothetical protein